MHLYRTIETYNLVHELNCKSVKKNMVCYMRDGTYTRLECTMNTNFVYLDKGRKARLSDALDQYFQRKLTEHMESDKKESAA